MQDEINEDSLISTKEVQDLTKTRTRFYALFLLCLLCVGSYFVYDNPAALETKLKERLHMDSVQFNLLYSIYSFPNIVFPLIGGILMDKFGARIILFITSSLVTGGQALFAFGVSIKSYPLAVLGRGIFGAGGETLELSQRVLSLKWFFDKELSMAFGLNSSFSLLGSVVNDNTEPDIVNATDSVVFGLWVGFFICVISFIAVFFFISIDRKRVRLLGIQKEEVPQEERVKCRDVKEFGWFFWILIINYLAGDTTVYCFSYIASGYLQKRFHFSEIESGRIMSILFFMAVFICPLCGILVDKIGKRPLFLIIAGVLIMFFHLIMLITPDSDKPVIVIFYFVLIGLGYSINMTIQFPQLSYVMQPNVLGTVFGIGISLLNLSLVVFPICIGYIQDNTHKDHGYYWVSAFLAILAGVGLVSAIIIYLYDQSHGGILNSAFPDQAAKSYKLTKKSNNGSFTNPSIN